MIKKIIDFIVNVPKDKVLCFTGGYIIAHVVNNLWCGLSHPSYGGAIIGLLVAHIVGIVKEVLTIIVKVNIPQKLWMFLVLQSVDL